jgi:hypothetical protein
VEQIPKCGTLLRMREEWYPGWRGRGEGPAKDDEGARSKVVGKVVAWEEGGRDESQMMAIEVEVRKREGGTS